MGDVGVSERVVLVVVLAAPERPLLGIENFVQSIESRLLVPLAALLSVTISTLPPSISSWRLNVGSITGSPIATKGWFKRLHTMAIPSAKLPLDVSTTVPPGCSSPRARAVLMM